MLINLNKIKENKHILIVVKKNTFANASALYSYLLTLHKKVSLYKSEDISNRVTFLPWYDKLRDSKPSSAEYVLEIGEDSKKLYTFFNQNSIKINKKMATSLYMALLEESDYFSSDLCDGTSFAMASELIALGADYKSCKDHYLNNEPLSLWRLKAKMYESMLLTKSATAASLFISDEILLASGATLDQAVEVLKDTLKLLYVIEATLYKSDENNKIIKEIIA